MASAERSFSKLKVFKNYLTSTMSQERLNGVATLCMEKKLLDKIDIDTIISYFAFRILEESFNVICIHSFMCIPILDALFWVQVFTYVDYYI